MEERLLYSATVDVLLVDSTLEEQQLLEASAHDNDYLLAFDSRTDTAASIIDQLQLWSKETAQKIDSLAIVSHGQPSAFELGKDTIDEAFLKDNNELIKELGSLFNDDAEIGLYGCEVAAPGSDFIERLADLAAVDVFASNNMTGSAGDWELEVSSADSDGDFEGALNSNILADAKISLANTAMIKATQSDDGWVESHQLFIKDGSFSTASKGEAVILSGFEFLLDSKAHINGIKLRVDGDSWLKKTDIAFELSWDGGNHWTEAKQTGWLAGLGDGSASIGDSGAELWGREWNNEELSADNFRARAVVLDQGGSDDIAIDFIAVKIFYADQTPPQAVDSQSVIFEDTAQSVYLDAVEADPGDALEAYRIDSLPSHGELFFQGNKVSVGDLIASSAVTAGGLVFTPAEDWVGSTDFTYSAFDGDDYSLTLATHSLSVSPIDDVAVNSMPEHQLVAPGDDVVFSVANGNAITVSDVDSGELLVSLSVDHGELTLATTAGLSFRQGDGEQDSKLVFSGTIEDINAALDGLLFSANGALESALTLTTSSDNTSVIVDFNSGATTAGIGNDLGGGGAQVVPDPADANNTVLQTTSSNDVYLPSDFFDPDRRRYTMAFAVNTTDSGGLTQLTSPYLIGARPAEIGGFGLWLDRSGELNLYENADGKGVWNTDTGVKINDGQWHQIAIANDGDNLVVYVDGIEVARVDSGYKLINSDISLGGKKLLIGSVNGVESFFDNLQVFDQAITAEQARIMSQGIQEGALFSSDTLYITAASKPVASDDSTSVKADKNLHTRVPEALDDDDNLNPFGYQLVSGPDDNAGIGRLIFEADGRFSFYPDGQYDGLSVGETAIVQFSYTASDFDGQLSEVQTITITINGVNDAPVADEASFNSDQNTVVANRVPTAADIDGDDVDYRLVSNVELGELRFSADGSFEFNPGNSFSYLAKGDSKTVVFSYCAVDEYGLQSDIKQVSIVVAGVDDQAWVSGLFAATLELSDIDQLPSISASIGIQDIDAAVEPMFFQTVKNGVFGSFSVQDGQWQYQPKADAVEGMHSGEQVTERFWVTASDGVAREVVITINIIADLVRPVEQPSIEKTLVEDASQKMMVWKPATGIADEGSYDLRSLSGQFDASSQSEELLEQPADAVAPVVNGLDILPLPELKDILSMDGFVEPLAELAGFERGLDDDRVLRVVPEPLNVLLRTVDSERAMAELDSSGFAMEQGILWQGMEKFERELQQRAEEDERYRQGLGAMGLTTMGVMSAWLLRAVALGSSLMAVLPAWSHLDPIAVLNQRRDEATNKNKLDEDEDDVGSLFDK
ncbi:VCBS repeat-containing protein [Sinobacterium caligoides]|uniref:VCBS repeat-containing protein n=1 Tax=Sinobacterium caligoides TaxID=933926 RepID=A0A3N2DZG3_9GAMM|nr:DUF4347 domain-containing protein [Sinobacterium caligoides]ROS04829.1 VCBS repeat-containing protein [Sinobacterium caligoides]